MEVSDDDEVSGGDDHHDSFCLLVTSIRVSCNFLQVFCYFDVWVVVLSQSAVT